MEVDEGMEVDEVCGFPVLTFTALGRYYSLGDIIL